MAWHGAQNVRRLLDARCKSLSQWPAAFAKVRLMIPNCTLAKTGARRKGLFGLWPSQMLFWADDYKLHFS